MTREEAKTTVANLIATGVFTKVWFDLSVEPFVDFTVFVKIENLRRGNNNISIYKQPMDEAAAKKAAKIAKKEAQQNDARVFANRSSARQE